MNLDSVSVPLALAAGAASFLSPCVLPLVPVYVAYLVRPAQSRWWSMANSAAFVAGVGVVMVLLFYALRTVLQPFRVAAAAVAGVLVIAFALHVAGVLRWRGLDRSFQLFKKAPERPGPSGGFLLGAAFATGWTPCVGPVLGAVLTSGATAGTTGRGLLMVAAYCVGLGVPFVLLGVGVGSATALRRLNAWRRPIDLTSAAVLGVMGVLLLTNNMLAITQWGSRILPNLDPFGL